MDNSFHKTECTYCYFEEQAKVAKEFPEPPIDREHWFEYLEARKNHWVKVNEITRDRVGKTLCIFFDDDYMGTYICEKHLEEMLNQLKLEKEK